MSIRKKPNGTYVVEVWDKEQRRDRYVKPAEFGMQAPLRKLSDARALERLAMSARVRSDETIGSFGRRWVRDFPRRSEATNKHNAERIKTFIEEFDRLPLRAFTKDRAEKWASANRHRVPAVMALFTDARKRGYVDENPFDGLTPKTDGRKHKRPPTIEDVHDLAACAVKVHGAGFGDEIAAMILWSAYTCMRPGEVYAASWKHLDGDTYYVAEAFNSTLGTLAEPKYGSSGTIIVPQPALDAVHALARRLNDDVMFRTRRGKMFRQSTHYGVWHPVRSYFGRPDLAYHELRHAGASYMLNVLGMPPHLIARQLRHDDETGGLVMKLYGHPDEKAMLGWIRQAFTPNGPAGIPSDTPYRTLSEVSDTAF